MPQLICAIMKLSMKLSIHGNCSIIACFVVLMISECGHYFRHNVGCEFS